MHTQPPAPATPLDDILQQHGHRPTELLQILIDTQQREGWPRSRPSPASPRHCTCLCDQGPAMLVNGRAIGQPSHRRINEIAELIRQQRPLAQWPAEYFHIDDNIRRGDALLALDMAPGAALSATIARGRDGWLAEVQASNLRGRGGAGFATAVKWASARDAPGAPKVIICNADQGEPGTFKDRVLLNSFADLVFEGMTLAAWAVGGTSGLCLAAYEFQRRIAYEDVPTTGAFMIFDGTRNLFEVARSFVHLFAHESCGFCTPCQVGTALLKNASHCGLGSAAPNPVFDTLQKFRPAYERRLVSLDFEPAFDLDAALAEARQLTARDDPSAHLQTHEEEAR